MAPLPRRMLYRSQGFNPKKPLENLSVEQEERRTRASRPTPTEPPPEP